MTEACEAVAYSKFKISAIDFFMVSGLVLFSPSSLRTLLVRNPAKKDSYRVAEAILTMDFVLAAPRAVVADFLTARSLDFSRLTNYPRVGGYDLKRSTFFF